MNALVLQFVVWLAGPEVLDLTGVEADGSRGIVRRVLSVACLQDQSGS